MSTTIKLRRSAVPGRIPTTSQLELGEIAINTADGKLYFKKFDPVANTESIVDVSADLDAAAILSLLSGVDGANSGLDADLLDGQEGSYYLDWNNFTNTETGVTANTYGSASLVPVITVDADGRITAANTVSVAGVSDVYWDTANNTFTIETADGGVFHTVVQDFSDITTNDITANNITSQSITTETFEANTGSFDNNLVVRGNLTVLGQSDVTNDANAGDISANNGVFAGDITVGGLVDGRDIAADGAKLDLLEDGLDLTLTGKVTGFASSNTGVMTLATELANTGVTPGVYGSSTAIPVFTVDEDGRLTTANTTPVAGVDDFSYAAANNTITLQTGDGSIFNIQTETEVTLTGKVTGTATATDGNLSIATELANTGVTSGTYGSSTAIPIITVDEDGRITSANTSSVAGVDDFFWTSANNTLTLQTGDGTAYLVPIDTFNNITANTINGRDITADGNKLDGIEPGATGDQTAQEILAALITVDGDGSGLDADSVDGYSASEILDAAANNAASLVGAGEVFVYANTGISITGTPATYFNLNSSNTHIIEIEHADTSSVADVSLTLPNVLTGLTFDTFGHVQTTSSSDLDTRYYTQTLLDSGQLDNRYYTETETDAKFVDVAGDTMTGDLEVQGDIIQNESRFISETVTTTSTSQTTLYAFPYATYGSAEVVVQITQGSNRHVTKLLITHDGSTPIATEFGTVFTSSELATFDIAFFGGQALQLNATPSSSSSTTFKIIGTLIDA